MIKYPNGYIIIKRESIFIELNINPTLKIIHHTFTTVTIIWIIEEEIKNIEVWLRIDSLDSFKM